VLVVGQLAPGFLQVQSMSEVSRMAMSHLSWDFTLQFSSSSSAADVHTCPKLSQYLSHLPPYGAVRTSAVQDSHVTPPSTSGHISKESQQLPAFVVMTVVVLVVTEATDSVVPSFVVTTVVVLVVTEAELLVDEEVQSGPAFTTSGRRQVQSMSDVSWISSLQAFTYLTRQSSFSSSAAATQTCPKLSQYVSHRPL